MSDTNERSGAPAGAVANNPAAWVLECEGWPARFFKADERQYAASITRPQDTLSPLYRQPQPTLTFAEREALEWAATHLDHCGWGSATLRGLLERLR